MDFRDSGQAGTGDVAMVMDEVLEAVTETNKPAPAKAAEPLSSSTVLARRFPVTTDATRDALLTEFGKETLNDRYLLPGESYQDLFARVAAAYADDADHAQRVYDYISRLWFMPATPVLSNGGADRGGAGSMKIAPATRSGMSCVSTGQSASTTKTTSAKCRKNDAATKLENVQSVPPISPRFNAEGSCGLVRAGGRSTSCTSTATSPITIFARPSPSSRSSRRP